LLLSHEIADARRDRRAAAPGNGLITAWNAYSYARRVRRIIFSSFFIRSKQCIHDVF